MERRAFLTGGLTSMLNDDIELVQVDWSNEAWTNAHPSGFGTFSPVDQGDFFEYNAHLIVATTTHLDDDDYLLYLNGISEWWLFSFVRSDTGLTPEGILSAYTTQCPDTVAWFAAVAEHNGTDLAHWLSIR